MAFPILPFLGGMASGLGKDLAGPIIGQSMSNFRQAFGWNDVAQARAILYRQNQASTFRRPLSDNYTPFRLSLDQAIQAFNKGRWAPIHEDRVRDRHIWERLQSNLKFNGVHIDISEQVGDSIDDNSWQGQCGREWARLIDMSSHGPPLHQTIRDYYRSAWLLPDQRNVTEEELTYQLRRASIRRKADRRQVMEPFYSYDALDAYRLKWLGLVDNRGKDSILNADGCIRAVDQEYMEHLVRRLPSPETLIHWMEQRLWDNDQAVLLGLDDGYSQSPIPDFFMRAQGIGVNDLPLPNEPNGLKDWPRLSYRSTRKAPSFSEAKDMQYRLRPQPNNPGMSVVPGVPPWLPKHTQAVLTHAGMPEPVIKQMLSCVQKPMDMDFIGETLSQALEHANVRAMVLQHFGPGYDWLKSEMLNHGFGEGIAAVGTEVVKQIATDKAYAERLTAVKNVRHAWRDEVLKAYEQGTMTRADVTSETRHRMYPASVALRQCDVIDAKVQRELTDEKIAAVKDAYFNGNLDPSQVEQQLLPLVINPDRRRQYMESWAWARTAKARHLTTAEILKGMKAGLFTPAQAVAKLTNLGWANPDALAEVALVQHEMQVSQQKAAAAQMAHQAALIQAEAQRAQAEARRQAAINRRAQLEQAKVSRDLALANHKKLMAESSYYAKVHKSNAAFAKAEKAGDQDSMNAAVEQSATAYHKWLLDQMKLVTQGKEVANAVGPIQTEPTPNTGQGTGLNESSPADGSSPDEPTGDDSGPDAEAPPDGALPAEPNQP